MNIARQILYLSSMVFTAIMVAGFTSCANEDFFLEEGGKGLSLQVAATGQAQTRSEGEEDLNENLMARLDYFFFKADASNNATGELVYHITETNQTSQIDHEYSSSLPDELLTGLFGSTPEDRKYCYVYVVVNYDGFTDDNITVGSTTLADIQNITFSTTLSTNAAQPSFVMAGGSPVQLRIVNGTYYRLATSRPIPVTRAAAKIDLVVTEVQQYTDRDSNGSRWESHPENMYVMFYNGVSKSYIYADAGHYITNPANTDYFSVRGSNMRQMTEIVTETGGHTGRYEHSIPFYSYMSNWSNDADHMSCLILVLPWQHIDRDGNEIQDGYQSTYYQIPTSLDKRYLENHYYQIEVMIGMIGSFELPDPVILDNNTYMVVDWGTQNVSAAVRESVYLIVEKKAETMNNTSSGSVNYISSHTVNTTVTQVKFTDYSKKPYQEVTLTGYQTHQVSYNGTNYTIRLSDFTVDANNGKITLTHAIPPYMLQSFEVTVRATMTYDTNKQITETVVFTQYPPIYIKAHESNAYVFINNNNNTSGYGWTSTSKNIIVGNGNNQVWLGSLTERGYAAGINSSENNTNPYIYEISISSLSNDGDFEYMLGDPRKDAENMTNPNITGYKPGRETEAEQYFIAPKFIIASSHGKTAYSTSDDPTGGWNSQGLTWERAKKRCAAYQEDGYPAGRWRLPTYAEVKFIMQLSAQGSIPSLFQMYPGGDALGYWCSNGRICTDRNNETYLNPSKSGNPTAPRCVYDTWYWGTEQPNNGQYNTTWSGYQTN